MAVIHRVGEPENESEAKAIKDLGKKLPDDYLIFHNLELTTGRGLPYEYDIVAVGEHAVYHVEVKGYRGAIRGDTRQWVFENGAVYPSPIPLANKKTKILAGKLQNQSRRLSDVFVETVVLLTDDRARVMIRDDQAHRVIGLAEAPAYLQDPSKLSVRTSPIDHLHDAIAEVLFGTTPAKKVKRIGLYDVIEKINQTDTKTVFLATHRYIRSRPKNILKVFHFDVYASEDEKKRQIEAIFHDQEAMRVLGAHPNLIRTGDMFAWDDNKFVLPTEYIEGGKTLEMLLDKEEDRKLTWAEKRKIIAKVAQGLQYSHKHGVIHRDVRPLNVVVAPAGEVKLVNFDLALLRNEPDIKDPKGLKERLDRRYVAPEVWLDPTTASEASDVYSLGILFYELITSRRPHEDVEEVLDRAAVSLDADLLLSELSTPGSEDFMKSPVDAAGVIERMCTYDPDHRYRTMDEVMEDLAILGD